jgi:diguanylate cyclase (GGDEF)-like protein/PAS domain S-box-containing protein
VLDKDKKDHLIDELTNTTKELKKDIYVHERVQEILVSAKNEWEQTFDAIPDIILVIDNEYKIVRANRALADKLGVKRESLIGKQCHNVIHGTENLPSYCPHTKTLSSGKEHIEDIYEDKLKGHYLFSSTPMHNEKGQLKGFLEIARNVSEQKLAGEALKQSEAKAKAISDSSIDGIIVIDGRGFITYFNRAAEEIFGYKAAEAVGKELHNFLVSENARKEYYKKLPDFENTGQCRVVGKVLEVTATRKDGTRFPVELSISSFQLNGQWYSAGSIRDITERKKMEKILIKVSITDPLTGLMNRRGFFNFAEKQIELVKRNRRKLSILFLDVNGLKKINDTLGHKAGDQALLDIADVLKKTLRSSDIIARMGGDEFTVLIIEADAREIETIIKNKIHNGLKACNTEMKREYNLSVSMGFAHYDPLHPSSIDELLVKADASMYEDKQQIKSGEDVTP